MNHGHRFPLTRNLRAIGVATLTLGFSLAAWSAGQPAPDVSSNHHERPHAARNVIIFVADGLRHGSVNATTTPTLFRVRRDGVNFINSHALFPTFTTPNASAIATSHYLGDTGDFSNAVYVGFPIF